MTSSGGTCLSDTDLHVNIYQATPGSADENALTFLSLNTHEPLDTTKRSSVSVAAQAWVSS